VIKQLGHDPVEAIELSIDTLKGETGVDLSVIFPEYKQKLFEKHHTHTAAQIASRICTERRKFTKKQVEDAFRRSAIIRQVPGLTKGTRFAPSGIASRAEPYVHSYDPKTNFIRYTDLALDLAYVVLTGNPSDWDFNENKPLKSGQKRLLNR
jgi:hypothetical protein